MFSIRTVALSAALITTVLGSPFRIIGRSVSDAVLARLNLFEQYSAASYCIDTSDPFTGTKITCSSGNCPLVQAANTDLVLVFENSLVTDVTGFVAVDSTNDLIVVAFRGSESLRDYVDDADFPLISTSICSGCEADMGFYDSWVEASSEVIKAVESAAAAHPSYEIVAAGHSLGGAIATIAAAQLRNSGYSVGLFTYGSPRVGNPKFAQYVSSQPGEQYRVTHLDDIVPNLPPASFGYEHLSGQYWITSANDVTVTDADITVFTGYGESGNEAVSILDWSIENHAFYFNAVSSCFPGGFPFR